MQHLCTWWSQHDFNTKPSWSRSFVQLPEPCLTPSSDNQFENENACHIKKWFWIGQGQNMWLAAMPSWCWCSVKWTTDHTSGPCIPLMRNECQPPTLNVWNSNSMKQSSKLPSCTNATTVVMTKRQKRAMRWSFKASHNPSPSSSPTCQSHVAMTPFQSLKS